MTGIVLLNLGGPETIEDVRPFLYRLFSDRRIIRLGPAPLQKPIAWLISAMRASKTKEAYGLIGGGSPILRITRGQASALEDALRGEGDFRVYVAMRYTPPFTDEAVGQARRDGAERLIGLTLYPHYSKATTGSSMLVFEEAAAREGMSFSAVTSWFDHPLYVEALADVIRKKLRPGMEVLFSAHSLPVRFIEEGDPYVDEIMGTIRAVAQKVPMSWHLGYQSRSGPVKWLEPSTEEALRRLASEGAREVLMVPVSFVSDHIETLYEIDILYKSVGEGFGLRIERTESLNTHPLLIGALKELALKEARKAGRT
ncbi:MAG: ferrochelatase [Thermodesulfovibrionales bacterium]